MLFIATIAMLIGLIIAIQTHSAIKGGRTLSRIQSNVASQYIVWSRKMGVKNYTVLGIGFMVAMALLALYVGAWISSVIFLAKTYYSHRTNKLLDATQFQATDAYGEEVVGGKRLTPIT